MEYTNTNIALIVDPDQKIQNWWQIKVNDMGEWFWCRDGKYHGPDLLTDISSVGILQQYLINNGCYIS